MNVSVNKLARRLAAVLVSLFAVVVLALPAAAAPQVDKTTPVNDYAGILSQDTIAYVTEISSALQSTCGAEIGVYTTEYIGNSTMEGYAYSVLNEWGLGSSDRDNGVLLLLAPGEDDYYITRGTGLESALSISTLGTILDDKMEPKWCDPGYLVRSQQHIRQKRGKQHHGLYHGYHCGHPDHLGHLHADPPAPSAPRRRAPWWWRWP